MAVEIYGIIIAIVGFVASLFFAHQSGKRSEQNKRAKQNIKAVKDAKQAVDDVSALDDDDVRARARERMRKSGDW